jgi:hypothetical protein
VSLTASQAFTYFTSNAALNICRISYTAQTGDIALLTETDSCILFGPADYSYTQMYPAYSTDGGTTFSPIGNYNVAGHWSYQPDVPWGPEELYVSNANVARLALTGGTSYVFAARITSANGMFSSFEYSGCNCQAVVQIVRS